MMFFPLILLLLLAIFGISLEMNLNAQVWQLFIGFHVAGLSAMTVVSLWGLKQLPSQFERYVFVFLQLLAFRIAYFPIVVFSATVACYSELFLSPLSINLPIEIFPALFVSAAILFAMIDVVLFWALKGKTVCYALIIIMGTPAVLISFADLNDLTFFPDNNWADINPLPKITQPQANPYQLALTSTNTSLGQKVIGFAGKVLYDFIPQAPWGQAVQGTLEQAYLKNPEENSHDQLRNHYAAFLAAQRAL